MSIFGQLGCALRSCLSALRANVEQESTVLLMNHGIGLTLTLLFRLLMWLFRRRLQLMLKVGGSLLCHPDCSVAPLWIEL